MLTINVHSLNIATALNKKMKRLMSIARDPSVLYLDSMYSKEMYVSEGARTSLYLEHSKNS